MAPIQIICERGIVSKNIFFRVGVMAKGGIKPKPRFDGKEYIPRSWLRCNGSVGSHARSDWDELSLLLLWENRKAQDLGFWSDV
jgi:hypothetical protein